jgi:hypothetical protein
MCGITDVGYLPRYLAWPGRLRQGKFDAIYSESKLLRKKAAVGGVGRLVKGAASRILGQL